jgi:hypothetical protein
MPKNSRRIASRIALNRIIMCSRENGAGIFEKRLLFLLHPGVPVHLRRVMMDLPAVADRKVIREDLILDEDEPVFSEKAVG